MKAKLIHLLFKCGVIGRFAELERIASELIANGVRLEEKQATSDESKWISVTEMLPKDSGSKFLAIVKEDGYNRIAFVTYLDGKWWDCFYNGFPQVTYWMPLPPMLEE